MTSYSKTIDIIMYSNERQAYRQLFLEVYHKMQSNTLLTPLEAQIAEVLDQHPYYHILFQNDQSLSQDFLAAQGEENPFLHMSLHLALQDQIKTDRPAGIAQVYQELLTKGIDAHEAEHQMLDILTEFMWQSLKQQHINNEQAYLEQLKQLLIRH